MSFSKKNYAKWKNINLHSNVKMSAQLGWQHFMYKGVKYRIDRGQTMIKAEMTEIFRCLEL